MRTVRDNAEEEVVEIDDQRIDGWIGNGPCQSCSSLLVYSMKFDAFFCPQCNVWSETCGDLECGYCSDRPSQPLAAV